MYDIVPVSTKVVNIYLFKAENVSNSLDILGTLKSLAKSLESLLCYTTLLSWLKHNHLVLITVIKQTISYDIHTR